MAELSATVGAAGADAAVWVVVPVFNEAAVIAGVIGELTSAGYAVCAVDDGSTDESRQRLLESRAAVLRHCVNLGQGAALQTGIDYALSRGARYVVTFDGDGQHRVADIAALLEPLRAGCAEVALGSRFLESGEAAGIPPARLRLLRLAIHLSRLSTGLKLSDTHNGLRAFTAAAARRISISQNRMAHSSQILAQIAAAGIAYCEVPVRISYSEYSLAKGQKAENALNIIWELILDGLGL